MTFSYDDEIQVRRRCRDCYGKGSQASSGGATQPCETCQGQGVVYRWERVTVMYAFLEDEWLREQRRNSSASY